MRGTKSKNEKPRPKNHMFKAGEGAIKLKSWGPKKAHLRLIPSPHTKFQLPSSIWWGDRGVIALFKDQNRKTPHAPSPSLYLRGWFLDVLYNYNFCVFGLSAPPPRNFGIYKFWLEVILTHIYLIHRQTEPIDQIGAILVCFEQSKWF